MPLRQIKSRLLLRCIDEPTPANLRHFVRKTKNPSDELSKLVGVLEEEVDSDPKRAFKLCSLALRLSNGTGSECLMFRIWNVLAHSHQQLGRTEVAERVARLAFQHGRECRKCRAVADRLRSRSFADSEDYDRALIHITRSIRISRDDGDVHDEGKSLLGRGDIYYRQKSYTAAIRDFNAALQKIDPSVSPSFHAAALHNLTCALTHGSQADALKAFSMLPKVEAAFDGLRSRTLERAKLKWVKGLLSIRIGYEGKGEKHLRSARKMLIRLELPAEVAAITADLAVVAHPERQVIRGLFRETLRLGLDWGKLRAHLEAAWDSTSTSNPFIENDPDGAIMQSIKALREAVKVDGIPKQFLGFHLPEPEGDPIGF